MASCPRVAATGTAAPPNEYPQQLLSDGLCQHLFGDDWATKTDVAKHVRTITGLFAASGVERRQMAAELFSYYSEPRTTGERMIQYEQLSYPLARDALEACLGRTNRSAGEISDFIVVSCTGYTAPGLDIQLARDLDMRRDVRRLIIGHMGCHGGLIGLRTALEISRARQGAVVALVAVELCSLHLIFKLDVGVLASLALFGDAAAAVLLTAEGNGTGPELIDSYCAADFETANQMSWKVTDEGFIMGLSRRIPITLRRNVGSVVDHLLCPHGLARSDITHWLVHPGGPDILEVVSGELGLSEEQIALSWQVLRENGNCSSATVLLLLNRLLLSGRARPGEWAVMMGFGPGLTLETCLLRF